MADDTDKKFTITNWIATVAIVASLGASIFSAVLSYITSTSVQMMQSRDADLKAFEEASKQLQEAGAAYVSALNKGQDLTNARDRLSAVLARQSIAALSLKPKVSKADEQYIDDYIQALRDFNSVSRSVSRPADFKMWAEAYGKTVDTGSSLSQAVAANAGRRS
ncbi:hypothetical protein [Methylobacterium fujisawaense]|uniref:hypothetical protein n=1 Tax=Methylobacterium fujisawaense TaxID=107400 RepID=UPI002F35440C